MSQRARTTTPDNNLRVWPLDGLPASMLDAIVSGLATLRSTVPRSAAAPAAIDLIAAEAPEGAVIAQTTRLLALGLIDEMVGASGRPSQFTRGAPDELEALTRAAASFHVSAAQRQAALGDADAIIREVGLEHDLDCHLATGRDGRDVIASIPIPRATAHVWLLDRLFQRAEMFVLGDEVLAYERMASAWYFSRWSVGGRGLDRESMAFTRNVREQEWSLVEQNNPANDQEAVRNLEVARQSEGDSFDFWRLMSIGYARLNNHGMTSLARAEMAIRRGQPREAQALADSAVRELKPGTPAWQRAQDIKAYIDSRPDRR